MRATTVVAGLALAGAAGIAYASLIERNAFRLRRIVVPALTAGSAPLRVLHISDVHMRPAQHRKQRFLRSLATEAPDLVVTTGDNLGALDGVPAVLAALEPLRGVPGAFVFGSNDYYAPKWKNPARYLMHRTKYFHGVPTPWPELAAGLVDLGWVDLTNRRATLTAGDRVVAVAGVDDPHLKRDDKGLPHEAADPTAGVRIALVHAPEPRVLDGYVASGYELMLAGHTHGGQLRLPGFGAIVTNCGLDRARARGLSRYGRAWLHVSPGLGTSPFAPVRFACRPEATLLTLVAADPV